jgi:hypothetical protein
MGANINPNRKSFWVRTLMIDDLYDLNADIRHPSFVTAKYGLLIYDQVAALNWSSLNHSMLVRPGGSPPFYLKRVIRSSPACPTVFDKVPVRGYRPRKGKEKSFM